MAELNWTTEKRKLSELIDWEKNPRQLSKHDAEHIQKSLEKFGVADPLVINLDNTIIGGHQRKRILKMINDPNYEVDVRVPERLLTDEEVAELNVRLNKNSGNWDFDILANEFEMDDLLEWGFSEKELMGLDFGDEPEEDTANVTLAERFIVPPFSVLDARQGYWQDRKRAWKDLGISGEIGRDENLICDVKIPDYCYSWQNGNVIKTVAPSTSIFDPVLCEIAYRWFMPCGGSVLDPFSGGSVRGIVAHFLGHFYSGIDLSERQIVDNRKQAIDILDVNNQPNWYIGDSNVEIEKLNRKYDFIFSCPPYYDLEVYGDSDGELSALGTYKEFIDVYRGIVSASVSKLKDDRFACFVVGDIRDRKGFYRNFPADTITAFQDAGMTLYNEAILITAIGSLPMRAGKAFNAGRKLGKAHQNVLIFYKGDPKEIKTWGDVEMGDIDSAV